MKLDRFDPFNNRLCRNVRNALSEGFKTALEQRDMQPVQRMAGFFLDDMPPAVVKNYVDKRLAAYQRVLAAMGNRTFADPLELAVLIWDQELFFETHEYLEAHWMDAAGEEKRLFQALIRAAGAYVHLEQGNLTGARRIADKALVVLEDQQQRLAAHADPRLLLDKLRRLDPVPPKLAGSADPAA
jgi:hypothetical protein